MCLSGIYFICCGTRDDPIDGWAITPGPERGAIWRAANGVEWTSEAALQRSRPLPVQRTAIGAVIPA
jgi:hypothetical protein